MTDDWPEVDDILRARRERRGFHIGDQVVDEDGNNGVVGIMYNDGDFVTYPGGQDAAHPNPRRLPNTGEIDA